MDGKGEGSKEEEEEGKDVGGSQVCLPGRWRKREGKKKRAKSFYLVPSPELYRLFAFLCFSAP